MPEDHAPARTRRWRKGYEEVVVAAVLLLGALFFRLRIDDFVAGRAGTNLDPDFWPGLLLSLAIVLSAVYLVLAIIWARRQDEPEEAAATVAAPAPATTSRQADTTAAPAPAAVDGSSGGSRRVGAAAPDTDPVPHADEQAHTGSVFKLVGGFLLLAAYIFLLGPIGFVPASAIFAVGFMMLVGERRWWVLLLFPIVAITVLLGVFTQLLVVSLPRGTGPFVDLSTYLY